MSDQPNTSDSDQPDPKRARRQTIGKVEEALGWATGDRRVEAEGHVRHQKAASEGTDAPVRPDEVTDEEQRVRRSHGDTR